MKKFIAAVVLAVSTIFATGCGSEENVGYVDQQRIMAEAPQMTALVEEGTKKADEVENETRAALDANPEMSDEERTNILTEYERKMSGVSTAYATQIQQKLDSALAEVCKEKNVTAVLDNSGGVKVLVNGGLDLTNDVINKLK